MNEDLVKRELKARFFRGNKALFLISVIAALLSGSLNLIVSWLTKQLIDAASGTQEAMPLATLLILTILFILLCVIIMLVQYFSQPGFIKKAMQQYKDYAFEVLMDKNISSFKDESSATYLSALTNDATNIELNYLSQLFTMITMVVTFFGALIMMLWYSPMLTAIAAGITILPLIASVLTGGRLEPVEKMVSEKNKDFTATIHDCLSGFFVVKSFKAEKEIFKLFSDANSRLEKDKFTRERIKNMVGMIGAVTGIIAQLGVFIAGAYLAKAGYGLTPGMVIMFVNLMNFTIEPVAKLPGMLANKKAALGLVDKLAQALTKDNSSEGSEEICALNKGIEFKNVSFGYEEDKEILHNISLSFEAGKSFAIVGGSGSGKSTLLNLLTAVNTNYSGNILLDGVEIKDIAPESLYELISVISQNVFVFNSTIKDNISMFRDFEKDKLDDAIKRAHLSELVTERGEDYLCGENGKGLSGGEKQRISIARSLLKKSSILLVDEATAALDAKTAHQVSDNILDLDDTTRIVVTHTLEEGIMKRYDSIIVLKNGSIIEQGDFDDLMEKKGYFYALFTVTQ